MAFLQTIREFFIPARRNDPEIIVSAPMTVYDIRPLTVKDLKTVLKLNLRCFEEGSHYNKYTFSYLLNEPNCLSYQSVTPKNEMVGFIFVMVEQGIGHITTIGVAPEHRRRGLAQKLLNQAETALQKRNISTLTLEVRVSNLIAQNLYRQNGFLTVQRLFKYYRDDEDAFFMVKSLF